MFSPRYMATFFNPLSIRELIWDHYPALLDSVFHYNLTDRKKTDWRTAILQTRQQIKALLQKEHIRPCTTHAPRSIIT